ncbi:hypothetical protein AHF37_04009 [Paragonimus kellicotti]|nr:hypothetical protein AHF37_04009 [Paragonimus kellicotti]
MLTGQINVRHLIDRICVGHFVRLSAVHPPTSFHVISAIPLSSESDRVKLTRKQPEFCGGVNLIHSSAILLRTLTSLLRVIGT